ncbi:hypothetical protein CFC21_045196 [Triticum aestivum]|uniref:Defensin-like protein n=4 Tax=Triticinae TaxID=1648030 RepID=A0A453DNI8_AEGTS|nr:keratin-associated protein 5-4 [Aegilops tauschii subsp. strangulata]KAF7034145.1 hypothetical protein CFC21_045196 [Triticum aestivum]
MAAGGAPLLVVVVVFSMLITSSLGGPRPLCSECETQCRTNCTAMVETSCRGYCTSGGGPRSSCRKYVFEDCNVKGTCCSSNGTCTCDCNTVAERGCMSVSDGTLQCDPCKRSIYDQCGSTCRNDCNNNCKKKGCRHD